jgi:hypothetical protein
MSVDSLKPIAPMQATEIKSEGDWGGAIKGLDKTEVINLDTERQEIAEKDTHTTVVKDGDIELQIYNAKGILVRKIPAEYPLQFKQRLIDNLHIQKK